MYQSTQSVEVGHYMEEEEVQRVNDSDQMRCLYTRKSLRYLRACSFFSSIF